MASDAPTLQTTFAAPAVLILVVMEDGLRLTNAVVDIIKGLNPCCNGRWSQTTRIEVCGACSLNPCCNGRWSQTY